MSFTDLEPWQRPQYCKKANEHIDVDMVFVDFEPRPWRQVVIRNLVKVAFHLNFNGFEPREWPQRLQHQVPKTTENASKPFPKKLAKQTPNSAEVVAEVSRKLCCSIFVPETYLPSGPSQGTALKAYKIIDFQLFFNDFKPFSMDFQRRKPIKY